MFDLKYVNLLSLTNYFKPNYRGSYLYLSLLSRLLTKPRQYFSIRLQINNKMSIIQNRSFLPNEFHSLSEQNNRLNQNLIQITLNHQKSIEQNRQLSEELNKKDYALIESTLRQKNLQHTLDNVKNQYSKLQEEHKQLYDWMHAQRKLEMRDLFKKESQLAMDLAFIERESYRESKKAKNQQLSLYQQRIIDLLKLNQTLKGQVLQITSEYNSKIHKLKMDSLQNDLKLKNIQAVESKFGQSGKNQEKKSTGSEGLAYLQLEIKLQNMKEKLEFYMKENEQIRIRNNELSNENKRLNEDRQVNANLPQQDNGQSEVWRVLQKENCSMQFITKIFQENTCLRKQIEQITKKYTLLAESYPKLIEEFDTIAQLQQNLQRLSNLKQLQHELQEAKIMSKTLQQSLANLEGKYLAEVKSRQAQKYKTSILTKRFNEIFIKMNPYFNIYQYESLELDQAMWSFFDSNKDYKQLKEYESNIFHHKRELKEAEVKFETRERQLKLKLEEKQRQNVKLAQNLQSVQLKFKEITESNLLLNEKMQKYQMIASDEYNTDLINFKIIDNEVTVPLLENMVQKLHLQREHLLQILYNKDQRITELTQQLHYTTVNQPVQTLCVSHSLPQPQNQTSTALVQFSQLLKHNETVQQKYESTVEQLTAEIRRIQKQLNDQHNLYQMEVKNYEKDYERKIGDIKKMLDTWMTSCQDLRHKIQLQESKQSLQKEKNSMDLQQSIEGQNSQNHQEVRQMQNENIMLSEASQPLNVLLGQPSHTNLDRIARFNDQGNNKLIGESTVQNLTSTLKKYEQQMSEVLTMCAKLSEEYSELKSKLKNQQELHDINVSLADSCKNLAQELKETKIHLEQKNKALTSIENLYRTKSAYCDELKSGAKKQAELIEIKLSDERKKNELLFKQLSEVKEKLYQVASKQQQQGAQSVMNKGQFETIVVMHANKNKENSQLVEKNKSLQSKIQILMQQLNMVKLKSFQNKNQEISPMQKAEFKQLSSLLRQTNLIEMVKRANEIIEKEKNKQSEVEQRQNIVEEAKQVDQSMQY